MEFLRSLLRRRFGRAQVATSRNVGCFLRLIFQIFRFFTHYIFSSRQICRLQKEAQAFKVSNLLFACGRRSQFPPRIKLLPSIPQQVEFFSRLFYQVTMIARNRSIETISYDENPQPIM